MKADFDDLSNRFGVDRKSRIERESDGDLSDMDLISNSRSVIVVLRSGYIKRMPLKTFESQGRGTRGKRGTSDGESAENEVAHCFTCNDHDTLLMVAQNGVAYGIRAYQIPTGSRTAKGQPIPSVLPLKSDDVITAVLPISDFSKDEYLVLATEHGWIKKTALSAFENPTSRGLTIASLADGDRLKWCHRCRDGDTILVGTTGGQGVRFEAEQLRPTGRTSRGVRAVVLRKDDRLADMNVLSGEKSDKEYVLAVSSQGFGKRVPTEEFPVTKRRGVGVIAMKFKAKNEDDEMSCLLAAREEDEILVITSKGIMVRQQVSEIPSQSRAATGVKIQRLDEGDRISSISIVPQYEEQDS